MGPWSHDRPVAAPVLHPHSSSGREGCGPTLGHNEQVEMRQFLTSPQSELAARIERAFLEESRASIVSVYLFGSHAEERSHRER